VYQTSVPTYDRFHTRSWLNLLARIRTHNSQQGLPNPRLASVHLEHDQLDRGAIAKTPIFIGFTLHHRKAQERYAKCPQANEIEFGRHIPQQLERLYHSIDVAAR